MSYSETGASYPLPCIDSHLMSAYSVAMPDIPLNVCWICRKLVILEESKTDEYVFFAHEICLLSGDLKSLYRGLSKALPGYLKVVSVSSAPPYLQRGQLVVASSGAIQTSGGRNFALKPQRSRIPRGCSRLLRKSIAS
jgi:hypothetical protein